MTEKRFQKKYIKKNNKVYDTWKEMLITDELDSDSLLNVLSHLNGLGEIIDTKIEQGKYYVKKYTELKEENEQLKLQYKELEISLLNNQLAYNDLEEENERLKKDIDEYNKKIEIMADAFLYAEDLIDVEEVFFTEVYEPSEYFDEELLCEISNLLFSDYLSDKND